MAIYNTVSPNNITSETENDYMPIWLFGDIFPLSPLSSRLPAAFGAKKGPVTIGNRTF
jgi:hypothetical protein